MNKRAKSIAPSVTLGLTVRAKAMKAEGLDVCSFAAGEPDFDTPENVKQAAIKALTEGQTKYAPVPGLPGLRKAIAEKLETENGLNYAPEQILVSLGAKHSLYNLIMSLIDDGDEVIIPAPYWLSYPEMVNMAGGQSVFVECSEDNDFKLTPELLEKAITPKSKALVLNSPSNPIGIVYSGEELRAIAEVAVKNDLYIISDEIYEKMVYDGVEHVSVGSLSDDIFKKTITVNGFSKAWSMTGWRLGYLAGATEIVKTASAMQSHSTSGAVTFAQYAAIEALANCGDAINDMVAAFSERRTYLYDRLLAIDGITCVKPMGAFYVLPNISSFGLDSMAFSEKLLDEEHVVTVPGIAFGADSNIRMSYACSIENIEKGVDRLEKFVKRL